MGAQWWMRGLWAGVQQPRPGIQGSAGTATRVAALFQGEQVRLLADEFLFVMSSKSTRGFPDFLFFLNLPAQLFPERLTIGVRTVGTRSWVARRQTAGRNPGVPNACRHFGPGAPIHRYRPAATSIFQALGFLISRDRPQVRLIRAQGLRDHTCVAYLPVGWKTYVGERLPQLLDPVRTLIEYLGGRFRMITHR